MGIEVGLIEKEKVQKRTFGEFPSPMGIEVGLILQEMGFRD